MLATRGTSKLHRVLRARRHKKEDNTSRKYATKFITVGTTLSSSYVVRVGRMDICKRNHSIIMHSF